MECVAGFPDSLASWHGLTVFACIWYPLLCYDAYWEDLLIFGVATCMNDRFSGLWCFSADSMWFCGLMHVCIEILLSVVVFRFLEPEIEGFVVLVLAATLPTTRRFKFDVDLQESTLAWSREKTILGYYTNRIEL